jgi:hypothetical protein
MVSPNLRLNGEEKTDKHSICNQMVRQKLLKRVSLKFKKSENKNNLELTRMKKLNEVLVFLIEFMQYIIIHINSNLHYCE